MRQRRTATEARSDPWRRPVAAACAGASRATVEVERTPRARLVVAACRFAGTMAAAASFSGAAFASTTTFGATADARVEAVNPSTNFGGSDELRADGGTDPGVQTFLRFDVSGLSGTVQQATLRLYATAHTVDGPSVYPVFSSWTESQITWANHPQASGGAVDRRPTIAANAWVDYNVTPIVTGNGTVSVVLQTQSTDGVNFASREATSNRPQLLVTTASSATVGSDATIVAGGDIACPPGSSCLSGASATAKVISSLMPTTVLALGDTQYDSGTTSEFAAYNSTWGIFKSMTHPVVGNHEYVTGGAAGYFGYFGAAAGSPSRGWYSFDVGSWHLIALNSECSFVGGCTAGSAQGVWLKADLAAHPAACTLAFFHRPRFSADSHHNDTTSQPFWDMLYPAGADLILNGHAHDYERLAPRTAGGTLNATGGIREFIVGTGGKDLNAPDYLGPRTEVNQHVTNGVLKLTLHPGSYDWRYLPASSSTFTDSGTTACH